VRITTRIATGLFLMAALLIGALTYQLSQVDRLQQVNLELSRTNLEASRISLDLMQGIAGVREFSQKAALDPLYLESWNDWERAVEEDLASLAGLSLEGEEARIRGRVEIQWRDYRATARALGQDASRLPEVLAMLDVLRGEVERLVTVNEASVAQRAEASAVAGERARFVARTAAGTSLALAAIASVLIFFSISGPLRHLTRGTRELAAGRFEHRLEIRGPAELAGLARDFNDMAARLNELDDLKRDFVSHVSHELKNPLAAVQETVEILLDELPGPLTQKQRRLLELARRSSSRLSSMIGDLLEVSRLEAGGVHYRVGRHDPSEIVRSVLEEAQPAAEEKDRRLELSGIPGFSVVCDGERLREVVANLVGNAIKFSPAGTRVEVRLAEARVPPPGVPEWRAGAVSRESAPFLVLTVSDEGIGVPDEHKAKIFEKFHQVAGRQRIQGQGVGLGLAISRRIVEAHGGAIWVEDRTGGGSSFVVLLPAVPSRWRDARLEEAGELPPGEGDERGTPTAEPAERERVASRATLAVLPFLFLQGCALIGAGNPEPATAEPVAAVETAPPAIAQPEPPPAWSVRLDRARALLAERSFAEAAIELEAALRLGAEGEALVEAHWGLAMIHLHPASSIRDEAKALGHLDIVEHEAPNGLVQAQAAWAREMVAQSAGLRAQIQERDELLRQLNEALEALRRIDLDRRPSGAAPPAGGSSGGDRP
jgi:two-component system sensor histidine kinase GlrK